MAKSFATSRDDYVKLQGSLRDGYTLHVQGNGPEVNRKYGVAADIVVTKELYNWLQTIPTGCCTSLCSVSNKKYFFLQARVVNGKVHFQVPWTPGYNRSYGASFDHPVDGNLVEFIEEVTA